MADTTGSNTDSGGTSAGITGAPLPAGFVELGTYVESLIAAQQARDDRLTALRAEADRRGDYTRFDEVAADVHAAASENLDVLLDALARMGIGADITASDRHAAGRDLTQWAAAGYATPSAVAEWTSIGIDTPAIAEQWVAAGFTAESASLWVEVPDMTPSEAASCAAVGMTPVDVERIRRADPGWSRPEPSPEQPDPGWGITP